MEYRRISLIGGLLLGIPLALHESVDLEQVLAPVLGIFSQATLQDRWTSPFAGEDPSLGDLRERLRLEVEVMRQKAWFEESLALIERAQRFSTEPL